MTPSLQEINRALNTWALRHLPQCLRGFGYRLLIGCFVLLRTDWCPWALIQLGNALNGAGGVLTLAQIWKNDGVAPVLCANTSCTATFRDEKNPQYGGSNSASRFATTPVRIASAA